MARRGRNSRRGPSAAGVPETVLLTGIKQGTGAAVTVPFGNGPKKSGRRRARGTPRRTGGTLKCWDAFHPCHLPLPRAVAPYTVIRTTSIFSSTESDPRRLTLFGPIDSSAADSNGESWTNGYAIGASGVLSNPMNHSAPLGGTVLSSFASMSGGSWAAASLTPAAFSIQIMNPSPLQETHGNVYIGRCLNKVCVSRRDLTMPWQDLADELVSYSNPRICSAAKLALRGVQVDAVPSNMNRLSDFTTLRTVNGGTFTLTANYPHRHDGFNPIFVYNPDAVPIQILVCCEWRVRFDPSNPAYAACTPHPPSSDKTWWNTMQETIALGSGAMDIATKAAALGRAL